MKVSPNDPVVNVAREGVSVFDLEDSMFWKFLCSHKYALRKVQDVNVRVENDVVNNFGINILF